jgi:cell division inhibitor SepF
MRRYIRMGFTQKLLNMMKFNDPDDYDEDFVDEYDEIEEDEYDNRRRAPEPEPEPEPEEEKKPVLSFRRKKKEEKPAEPVRLEPASRVIPFYTKKEEGEIVKVIKPQEFNEAQIVADFLKEGKTIVVNLEGIEISQAQRIIDFIGGASFAVDGSLKAISNNIFIVAPGNIEVSGDLRDEIISDSMLSPELGKF